MSNKPISMQKLRQVIRLHGQGKGTKSINRIVGLSRNTVKKYLQIFHASSLSYDQFYNLNDSELALMFQVQKVPEPSQKRQNLEALFPELCKKLKKKGVTREQLHKQYLEQYPDGYSLSSFCNYLQLYLGQSHPVMHIEHKAGEKMYIDFAVTKGSKYEAIINLDFANFAEHYATTVIPARAYKPRDKSLVEGAVKLIYKNIYTKLDNRVFHDIESLNAAIRLELEVHNNTAFSGRCYSRRQQFEEIEREVLGKLNPFRYQIKEQAIVTVMKNGYVRLSKDIHYYSVPYQYIGKKVKILYAAFDVEVYYQYELIAKHKRQYRPYQYTTDIKHLASQHQFLTDWSPENFIKRAAEIHQDVASYIAKVLEAKPFPEQAYKSCSGILNFARRVGSDRLIDACRWAESFGQYSYRTIEEILQKHLDKLQPEVDENEIPFHKNIRGGEYYK